MYVAINLSAVVLLLVANGFSVTAQFALVKAQGFRIETLASERSAAARLPVVVNEVETAQFRLRVLSLQDHRVGRVAIENLSAPACSPPAAETSDGDDPAENTATG